MPFEPKGEVAQWRIVYRIIKALPVGGEVTYEQLATALELDARADRHRVQAAARQAARHMLRTDDRAVETLPDVGYRVVPAPRQIKMAGAQVERATKSLDRGKELTTHVRLDELSEQERQIIHAMTVGFSAVAEWARQIGKRVEDHDGRLSSIEAELKRMREQRGGVS